MNANELADELHKIYIQEAAECWDVVEEAATMLRQQQADYYSLLVNHDKLYAKVLEQQAEIEALKAKTLTDEEIISSAEEARFNWSEDKGIFVRHSNGSWIGLDSKIVDFARAILRKAQEK